MLQCRRRVCRQNIGGNGVYYFKTELAGDETKVGWGSDPEPHIHYHLICKYDFISGRHSAMPGWS